MQENNKAMVAGRIVSGLSFSNEVYGEKFYQMMLEIERSSGRTDIIPLMVSDRLINTRKDYTGCMIEASGQYRSHNRKEGERNRLELHLFVQELYFVDKECGTVCNNCICLNGYVCKPPVYRVTPLGREIADILLAVNRQYGKSDYIPCIAWGRNAGFAAHLEVGTRIDVQGRIQSREYNKQISETEYEKRIAYEISLSRIEVVG